jgi:hypothetical protein
MKNRLPFIILSIIHTILLLFVFYRKGRKTFPLLMISIGMAYVFEYFVLNLFKMYWYSPKFFRNRWIDSVFGALMSQAVFVPIVGTFLTLFNKGWKWKFGASFAYGVVERIFIYMGVFKNKRWHTIFTVSAMPIYFYILAKWWEGVQKGDKMRIYLSLFLNNWINYTNVLFFSLALFHRYRFSMNLGKEKYWEHFILVPVYTFLSGAIVTLTTISKGKYSKFLGSTILHIIDRILFRLKIIQPSGSRSLYNLIPIHIGMQLVSDYYFRLVTRNKKIVKVD